MLATIIYMQTHKKLEVKVTHSMLKWFPHSLFVKWRKTTFISGVVDRIKCNSGT
jgi:hypothetical protein